MEAWTLRWAVAALIAMLPVIEAQVLPAPAFEVASVKASKAGDSHQIGMRFLPGGRLVATNQVVQLLISSAYNLPFQSKRLSGGPEWIRSDRYDIEAKADTAAADSTQMRLMLRKLLADRFHLALRRETRELPVYAIVVAKKGPKLKKAKVTEKDCVPEPAGSVIPCHALFGGQGKGLHGQAVGMSDLAAFVENFSLRPVIDKTGIQGLFSIDTSGWAPLRSIASEGAKAEDGTEVDTLPSIFTIFAGLGLKLEAQKAPVETYVIEHIGRPTEN